MVDNILRQKTVFDTMCENLSDEDQINFSISVGMLDHLFLKSVTLDNISLEYLILELCFDKLSENILLNLTCEQWKIISISNDEESGRLSEEFIRKYKDHVDWKDVSTFQILSEEFIREFSGRVDWECIAECQVLSEEFIREYVDHLDWRTISFSQKLSEHFIEEFEHLVHWDGVSMQQLSEDFIRRHADKVDWTRISLKQKLSEDFIAEFEHRVKWKYISINQCLSDEFLYAYRDRIYWYDLLRFNERKPSLTFLGMMLDCVF